MFCSLLKQIQVRSDSIRRNSNSSLNRKPEELLGIEEDLPEAGTSSQIKNWDSYGCVNYMPEVYSDGESVEGQEEKRSTLKQKYLLGDEDQVVKLMMSSTYYSQRKDIVEEKFSVPKLQMEWPYLSEQKGMFMHFENLTRINIKEKLESSIAAKGPHILKWLKESSSKQVRKIHELLITARTIVGNNSPEVSVIFCAIMAHFNENEEFIYKLVEVGTVTEISR